MTPGRPEGVQRSRFQGSVTVPLLFSWLINGAHSVTVAVPGHLAAALAAEGSTRGDVRSQDLQKSSGVAQSVLCHHRGNLQLNMFFLQYPGKIKAGLMR